LEKGQQIRRKIAGMGTFASRLRQESNEAGVQFLLTELATAHTFLDIAGVTENAETRERNLRNAHEAYCVAARHSAEVAPTDEQSAVLRKRFDEVKARLTGAGYEVDS
jgi:hypothetical protein